MIAALAVATAVWLSSTAVWLLSTAMKYFSIKFYVCMTFQYRGIIFIIKFK